VKHGAQRSSLGTPFATWEVDSRPATYARPEANQKQSARSIARGSQWIGNPGGTLCGISTDWESGMFRSEQRRVIARVSREPYRCLLPRHFPLLDANTSIQFDTYQTVSQVSRETVHLLSLRRNSSGTDYENAICSEFDDRPALFHVKQSNLLLHLAIQYGNAAQESIPRHPPRLKWIDIAEVFSHPCSRSYPQLRRSQPGSGRRHISSLSRPLPRRIVHFEYEKGSQIASSKRNQ
jgi:hypothetical protein